MVASKYPRQPDARLSDRTKPKIGNRLNGLEAALADFIKAKNKEAAEAAARRIETLSDQFALFSNGLIDYMRWPQFPTPPKRTLHEKWVEIEEVAYLAPITQVPEIEARLGIFPAWQQHRAWGLESPIIGKTLWALHIQDPALEQAYHGELPGLERLDIYINFDALRIGQSGHIIGHEESLNEFVKSSGILAELYPRYVWVEERRVARAKKKAEALLASGEVNWQLLEQGEDFSAFVDAYADVIAPHFTVVPDTPIFAQALLEKIAALLEKNPEKYRPVVRRFFSANFYKDPRFSYEKPLLKTIPDLIDNQTIYRNPEIVSFCPLDRLLLGVGIALDHPYIQFVLHEATGLFSTADKLQLLRHTRFLVNTAPSPFNENDFNFEFTFDFRPMFGYAEPKTPKQLLAMLHQLEGYKELPRGYTTFVVYHAQYEICLYLEDHKHYLAPEIMERIAVFSKDRFFFDKRMSKALANQVQHNAVYELRDRFPLNQLTQAYRIYSENRLFGRSFANPDLQKRYAQAIGSRLAELKTNPQAAIALAENLLFHIRVDDPALRAGLVQAWVGGQEAVLGRDDKTPDYLARVQQLAELVCEKAKGFVAFTMLADLAAAIEAQQMLAYAIRDRLQVGLKAALSDKGSQVAGVVGEFGLAVLAKNQAIRQETIAFLTRPLSHETTLTFYRELLKSVIFFWVVGQKGVLEVWTGLFKGFEGIDFMNSVGFFSF